MEECKTHGRVRNAQAAWSDVGGADSKHQWADCLLESVEAGSSQESVGHLLRARVSLAIV